MNYENIGRQAGSVGQAIAGYSGADAVTSQPQPPVHRAIDALDKMLGMLYSEVDSLAGRLEPVLSMAKPQPVSNDKQPNTPSVAGRIETCADAVRIISRRLSELRERLEV